MNPEPSAINPELKTKLTLRLKTAQKPYIVWSLGPKALKYGSSEPEGKGSTSGFGVWELKPESVRAWARTLGSLWRWWRAS